MGKLKKKSFASKGFQILRTSLSLHIKSLKYASYSFSLLLLAACQTLEQNPGDPKLYLRLNDDVTYISSEENAESSETSLASSLFQLPTKNAQAKANEEEETGPDLELTDEDNESLNIIGEADDLDLDSPPSEIPMDVQDFVLCDSSVYMQDWKKEFDKQWLAENSIFYKSSITRQKALDEARAHAFLVLMYPTVDNLRYDYPVVINQKVIQWINYFRTQGKRHFVTWLRRGQSLVPKIQETFERHGIPKDLAYLSLIESGFNNKALSSAGAVGPWQFMYPTAKQYKLSINDYIDSRRDPEKSTKAAAKYLTELYSMFGDWHLATASYNAGPGRISRAVKKGQEGTSFFNLALNGWLPAETSNYVPKLIAALIISKNPAKFGFDLKNTNTNIPHQEITIKRSIVLADLSRSLNIDKTILEDLNPELRLGITPPQHISGGNYLLRVPASKAQLALTIIDTLPEAPQTRNVVVRVRRKKETVTLLAKRYGITVDSILAANPKISRTSMLRQGQVINMPMKLGSGKYTELFAKKKIKKKKKQYSSKRHQKKNKSKFKIKLKQEKKTKRKK